MVFIVEVGWPVDAITRFGLIIGLCNICGGIESPFLITCCGDAPTRTPVVAFDTCQRPRPATEIDAAGIAEFDICDFAALCCCCFLIVSLR